MTDDHWNDVFRCDYCGQLAPLKDGTPFYVEVDELSDGRRIHIAAVYCSTYCGRTASSVRTGSRG